MAVGKRSVNKRTGAVIYRRTAPHFADLVDEHYGDHYTRDAAIEAYHAEQDRQKALAREDWKRFFRRLDAMPDAELIAYVAGRCRSEVAELAREGATFDKHLYRTRLRFAREQLECGGLTLPAKPTRLQPEPPRQIIAPRPLPIVDQADLFSQSAASSRLIARLKERAERATTTTEQPFIAPQAQM
jgi:hypothetical protein